MPPRRSAETMERDHRAYDLFRRGLSYRQICDEIGYASTNAAFEAVRRAAKENAVDPVEAAADRQVILDRLQDYRRAAQGVLANRHYILTQSGRLAEGPDGRPLIDDDPVLKALDRLAKLDDLELKIRDLYPAAKSRVEVVTEEAAQALAAALEAQVAELDEDPGGSQQGDPGEDR